MSTTAEQIDALQTGIARLDIAIAQTQDQLDAASEQDLINSLTATLIGQQAERSRLQTILDNLQDADVEVEPL